MSKRILAISSSRVGNSGYLENAAPLIQDFLGSKSLRIAFVPFASVAKDYEAYGNRVKEGLANLNHKIYVVQPETAVADIVQSDVIMVGGGNTFKLLHDMYRLMLHDVIRDKVNSGTPYIGWSAGANITGATICTTNDMPVIQPKSFDALALFPFQINPHYNNEKPAGHNGETRDERLTEFLVLNTGVPIVALPEGTALQLENDKLTLIGETPGFLFTKISDETPVAKHEIIVTEDLSWLL